MPYSTGSSREAGSFCSPFRSHHMTATEMSAHASTTSQNVAWHSCERYGGKSVRKSIDEPPFMHICTSVSSVPSRTG